MRISRLLKYGISSLAAAIVIWTVTVWTEWLPRPTQAQQDALALMHAPSDRVVGARNAWEMFWLLPYEIPDSARPAVLAEDLAALDARYDQSGMEAYESVADGRYPRRIPELGGTSKFCAGQESCLAAVRADPEAAEAEWQAKSSLLEASRRLADHDHFRTPHRISLSSPIPSFGSIRPVQMLDVTRQFLQGRPDEALDRLCQDTAAWRRLKGRSDSLIFEMFNASLLLRAVALYAEMRAELPRDYPLPDSCSRAFAPAQMTERQSCDVYRSEFRMFEGAMRPEMLVQGHGEGEAPSFVRAWMADMVINQQAGTARAAERFAALCATIDLPAERAGAALRSLSGQCSWMDSAFDPLGCILMDIASPAYVDYWKRDRDWEGSLRLLALAERLAAADNPAAAFEAEGALRGGFEQEVRFEQGRIAMKMLRPSPVNEPWWSLPLPGSAFPAAGSAAAGDASD